VTAMTDWQPTEWWAVFGTNGLLLYEDKHEPSVRSYAVRLDLPVRRLWQRTDSEWRPA